MGKEIKVLVKSSFNGTIMALGNMKVGSVASDFTLLSAPYVVSMPLLNPHKGLLYLPNEWLEARFLIKNAVLSAWEHNPLLKNKHVMLSVLPASEVALYHANRVVSALPACSSTLFHEEKLSSVELHPTHNLVLIWADDYSEAKTVNSMM